MNEQILQFIWLHRLYVPEISLQTEEGLTVQVVHPGHLNHDAGPDFLDARLRIGATLWAGHIELHIRSSDWNRHRHQYDPRYTKLIAHVVYEHDQDIGTCDNSAMFTISLKSVIDPGLMYRIQHLMQQPHQIPCSYAISAVRPLVIRQQLDRMMSQRLEERVSSLRRQWLLLQKNWQQLFFVQTAKAFGLPVNQDAFEQLALHIPCQQILAHRDQLFQVEAILFGQSGFLSVPYEDPYPQALQQEYTHWARKYSWTPLPYDRWKFLRMRPASFPTLRMAQLALFIHQGYLEPMHIVDAKDIRDLRSLLNLEAKGYWKNHYHFQQESTPGGRHTGKEWQHTVIINAWIPFVFFYAREMGYELLEERALQWLQQLPAEKNKITRQWAQWGLPVQHAADSQAILQLQHSLCENKQCLHCNIGYHLIRHPQNQRAKV